MAQQHCTSQAPGAQPLQAAFRLASGGHPAGVAAQAGRDAARHPSHTRAPAPQPHPRISRNRWLASRQCRKSGKRSSSASATCAANQRSWSAGGLKLRLKSSPHSPSATQRGCAASARSSASVAAVQLWWEGGGAAAGETAAALASVPGAGSSHSTPSATVPASAPPSSQRRAHAHLGVVRVHACGEPEVHAVRLPRLGVAQLRRRA